MCHFSISIFKNRFSKEAAQTPSLYTYSSESGRVHVVASVLLLMTATRSLQLLLLLLLLLSCSW